MENYITARKWLPASMGPSDLRNLNTLTINPFTINPFKGNFTATLLKKVTFNTLPLHEKLYYYREN